MKPDLDEFLRWHRDLCARVVIALVALVLGILIVGRPSP